MIEHIYSRLEVSSSNNYNIIIVRAGIVALTLFQCWQPFEPTM